MTDSDAWAAVPYWPHFASSDDALETLAKLSRYYGQLPGLVIAGGGNTSVKEAGTLHVKASGVALASITRDGFVSLDRARLQKLCDTDLPAEPAAREAQFKQAVLAARLAPERGQRPSVEALLHHLLPGKFVVHSHATLVNAVTCCAKGAQIARDFFGDEALWIPYVDPGYILARTLMKLLEPARVGSTLPKIILMGNHGMIISADTPDEIRHLTDRVLTRVDAELGKSWKQNPFGTPTPGNPSVTRHIAPALRGLLAESDTLKVVTFDDSPLVASFVSGDAAATLPFKGPLNPDQIVYCNSFPLYIAPAPDADEAAVINELSAAIATYKKQHACSPRICLVKGLGLLAIGDDYRAAATGRDLYKDAIEILAGASRLGGPTFLSTPHREFIEQWEVEAYRKQIAAGSVHNGRAAGKIAIVTGAAQGFGLEIAQAFTAAGGTVALADINAAGAQSAAAALCTQHGSARAIGLEMDVTNAASIAATIDQVVRTYGGFDVFISNAGVLKAESVKTQSEADFDLVTAVNYKGYFLCVQQAAAILATQHKVRPEYLCDIIQINSKSGLEGSNKNFAYAGSKFGGIGLTQSFALELIADGRCTWVLKKIYQWVE